jgi:ubiquinone/menaquinone biosynthesis C-methylase UbiE
MKKADYSKIASSYDKGRPLSEDIYNLWLNAISRLAKAPAGSKLLDIGCGTGRFTIPLATKLRFKVTGADSSEEMLAKAREKDTGKLIKWNLQDAQDLTYSDNSFDIVFMSHLLHHCDDPDKVIHECWRVLKVPGVILLRYGAIEQIRDDVEHVFFPEALAIDEPRTFSIRKTEECLKEAGFAGIISEEIIQRTYDTGYAHSEAIMVKSTSVLTMISPESFEKGINKLRAYVEKNPDDPWLLDGRMTLTAGYKGDDSKPPFTL